MTSNKSNNKKKSNNKSKRRGRGRKMKVSRRTTLFIQPWKEDDNGSWTS